MFEDYSRTALTDSRELAETQVQFQGVELTELPMMEAFNLRLQTSDKELLTKVNKVLGVALPVENNTFVIHENNLCCWYGPDEWLVVVPLERAQFIEDRLHNAIANHFACCVRVGDAQTMFRLTGSKVYDFLARGLVFDVHPSVFRAGECAQTILAHTNVTLLNHEHSQPMFDLIVRRSFADHLWRWLLDVGEEAQFRARN